MVLLVAYKVLLGGLQLSLTLLPAHNPTLLLPSLKHPSLPNYHSQQCLLSLLHSLATGSRALSYLLGLPMLTGKPPSFSRFRTSHSSFLCLVPFRLRHPRALLASSPIPLSSTPLIHSALLETRAAIQPTLARSSLLEPLKSKLPFQRSPSLAAGTATAPDARQSAWQRRRSRRSVRRRSWPIVPKTLVLLGGTRSSGLTPNRSMLAVFQSPLRLIKLN